MRVPIFEQIEISHFEISNLKEDFLSNRVGHRPVYISLLDISEAETKNHLENIKIAMDELSIHPVFPYPTFIITIFNFEEYIIPTASSVNKLPQHFLKKLKRLKKKEQDLLNKVLLLSKKVRHRDLKPEIEQLNKTYRPTNELFKLTKEYAFYREITNEKENS